MTLFLTTLGSAKLTTATTTGTGIQLTQFVIGSGENVDFSQRLDAQSLTAPVYQGAIESVSPTDTPNQYAVACVVPPTAGGFTIAEVGLIDSDGALIWVGSLPSVQKPDATSPATVDYRINCLVSVDNYNGAVTLTIDPNVVTATRQWTQAWTQQWTQAWVAGHYFDQSQMTAQIDTLKQQIADLMARPIESIPLGGILTTTKDYADSDAVAKDLGYGHWVRFAKGLTLLGYSDTTITDTAGNTATFNQMGQVIGEYSHTLTVDEMPKHQHAPNGYFNKFAGRASDIKGRDLLLQQGKLQGSPWINNNVTPASLDNTDPTHELMIGGFTDTAWDNTVETTQGNNQPHNNIQPSVVVAFWLRVPADYVGPVISTATPPTTSSSAVVTPPATTPTTSPSVTTPSPSPTVSTVALDYTLAWGASLTLTDLIKNVPDWQTGHPTITEINSTPITHQAGQIIQVPCVNQGWSLNNGVTLLVGADPEHTLTLTAVSEDIATASLYPIGSDVTHINNTTPSIASFWVMFKDDQNTVMVTCTLTLPAPVTFAPNADASGGGD